MAPHFGLLLCVGLLGYTYGETLMKCHANGHVYNIGTTYADGCRLCTCKVDGPQCSAAGLLCLGKRNAQPESPMKCHSSNGQDHNVGSIYADGCDMCTCKTTGPDCSFKGILCIIRRSVQDHDGLFCTRREGLEQHTYVVGQIFASGCNTCTCTRSGITCVNDRCFGRRAEGQEVPTCTRHDLFERHTYFLGETYTSGCDTCRCTRTGITCVNDRCFGKRAEDTQTTCHSWGMTHNVGDLYSSGCDLCKCTATGPQCSTGQLCTMGKRGIEQEPNSRCDYGGKSHALGESFGDGCHYCTCTKLGVSCLSLPCGRKRVAAGTSCVEGGFTYKLGERYEDTDKSCVCSTFGMICSRLGVGPLGKRATTCVSNGFTYQLGESYTNQNQRCSCTVIGMMCMEITRPLGKRGAGPTCSVNGVTYHQGETFNDGCNDCMCGKWGLTCTAMFCGPVGK